jgi:trk system potassium uptake protein TrkA
MYVVVIGGGNVGYHLTRELLQSGHEVVMIEMESSRARQIRDELGSMVIAADGCEGRYQEEAGMARADIIAAVTGDDEDNLVACQVAKMQFNVPRSIARVNNPKNEDLFRHLGIDDTVSATRMILGVIEHKIPVHDLLHLTDLEGGDVQIVEAYLDAGAPVVGQTLRDVALPDGTSVAVVVRGGRAIAVRPETRFMEGDRILAVTSADREDELQRLLIGS